MVDNLDSAFERRFLFKVKFNNPDSNIVKKIWKNKIKDLTNKQYKILIYNYDFSGGQINNIARKIDMYDIINGILPSFDMIIEYCNAETIINNKSSVGF